jgi:hypothetical protein
VPGDNPGTVFGERGTGFRLQYQSVISSIAFYVAAVNAPLGYALPIRTGMLPRPSLALHALKIQGRTAFAGFDSGLYVVKGPKIDTSKIATNTV